MRSALMALALLSLAAAAPLEAQSGWGTESGTLLSQVHYHLIQVHEGDGAHERSHIVAVLLWRDPLSAQPSMSPSEHQAAERRYREAARAAEDRGRAFLGGLSNDVVRTAEYEGKSRRLFVLGHEFALADAPRDSALVVLIDDAGFGEAPVVGTAWVPNELPSEAWGRSWSSGDTTFIVHPRQRDVHVLAMLRRSAAVRAFLPSSPPVAARSATAASQTCGAPPQPFFEFQVDEPAAYRGDTTRIPRPAREQFARLQEHPEALVVRFVVDTLGVPEPRSFRVLQSPSAAAADSARLALPDWRFTPARRGGCRVPQLVQTAITR